MFLSDSFKPDFLLNPASQQILMPDSLNMFMISSQFGKGNEMKMNSSEKELKEHEMNEKEMKTNTYCIQLLHNVPVTQQLKDMFGSNF